jgi:hypothetical protein
VCASTGLALRVVLCSTYISWYITIHMFMTLTHHMATWLHNVITPTNVIHVGFYISYRCFNMNNIWLAQGQAVYAAVALVLRVLALETCKACSECFPRWLVAWLSR